MTPTELLELWKKKSALHSEYVYDRDTTASKVVNNLGLYMDTQYDNSNGENTLYVTFRGTEFESSKDWYTNLRYGKDQFNESYGDISSALTSALSGKSNVNVVFTGHSLGGMLAQRAASAFAGTVNSHGNGKVTLITYDAPPISSDISLTVGTIHEAIHYYVEGSLVPMLGGGPYVSGQETSIDLKKTSKLKAHFYNLKLEL